MESWALVFAITIGDRPPASRNDRRLPGPPNLSKGRAIDHIVMNCRDVEATASWYERALGSRAGGLLRVQPNPDSGSR